MVSLMINDKQNLDFDQQDALILQLQASFEHAGSSEQVDVIHYELNLDQQFRAWHEV